MRDLASVRTVGVVGAGRMGGDIAEVAARAGFEVVLQDAEQGAVADSLDRIEGRLGDGGEDEDPSAIRDRIEGTTDLGDLAAADYVIEAVIEDLGVKQDVFADLDDVLPEGVPIATNTSTLPVTAIASATGREALVAGLHFMNPATEMPGVEVVVGERTAPATAALAHDLAEAFGKETWEATDRAGFVVNRVLLPWINEGVRVFDEGVAGKRDVDRALELGTNAPVGPLELADHIGLDVCLRASEALAEELGERFRPAPLIRRKVAAGDLGRKTGRGFYEY